MSTKSYNQQFTAEFAIKEIDSHWTKLSSTRAKPEQNHVGADRSSKATHSSVMSKELEKDNFAKQKKTLESKIGELENELK